MNWLKPIQKGGLAVLTFAVAYLASNPQVITNLLPENIAQMTIGSAMAAAIVALANVVKHWNK